MTTFTIVGFLASLFLWYGAMQAIVWSWSRRVDAAVNQGIVTEGSFTVPTVVTIARRHTMGWTLGFGVLFVLLTISSFPFWQQLSFAACLAVLFGSVWLSQSDPGGRAKAAPLANRVGSNIWYWLIAVVDWLGYLCTLCFAVDILSTMVRSI
jgi:hypothetical protein